MCDENFLFNFLKFFLFSSLNQPFSAYRSMMWKVRFNSKKFFLSMFVRKSRKEIKKAENGNFFSVEVQDHFSFFISLLKDLKIVSPQKIKRKRDNNSRFIIYFFSLWYPHTLQARKSNMQRFFLRLFVYWLIFAISVIFMMIAIVSAAGGLKIFLQRLNLGLV